MGGSNYRRIIGQSQIVIGTKVDHLLPILQRNFRPLGRGNHPLGFIKAFGFQSLKPVINIFFEYV